MSFNLVLQKNISPANYVDKFISDVATVTGTLREGTSVTDPSFLIESTTPADVISNINYVYCSTFKRYYYVNEIISEYNGLWRLNCHVDVLMTYRDKLRELSCIVARNENSYNSYLDDGSFMAYSNPMIDTLNFDNPGGFAHQEFVLTVAGS